MKHMRFDTTHRVKALWHAGLILLGLALAIALLYFPVTLKEHNMPKINKSQQVKTYRIFKFSIPLNEVNDIVRIPMRKGAILKSVLNQHNSLCLYYFLDPSEPDDTHEAVIRVAGTGHPINNDNFITRTEWSEKFIGTVSFMNGDLVFHVFDLGVQPLL